MSKGLNQLRDEATEIAAAHGFTGALVLEDFMLMVSEIAEATEDHRIGRGPADWWSHNDKPCGIPSEMADVIIRVLHFCGKHEIDIEKMVEKKMAYNRSRPYKHGKKI